MIRTRGLSYTYATGSAAPLRFPDVDLRQGGLHLGLRQGGIRPRLVQRSQRARGPGGAQAGRQGPWPSGGR